MLRILFLIVGVLLLSATPLSAQGPRPPIAVSKQSAGSAKSPTTARIIGILPGAGHVYAGETQRGLTIFGGLIGLGLIGGVALAVDCAGGGYGTDTENCGSSGAETALTIAVLGVWGWSIYDAGLAARRTNAARGLRTALIVAPHRSPRSAQRGRAVNVGLSFTTK